MDAERLAAFDRWYQETTARAKAHPGAWMPVPRALRDVIGTLPEVQCPCLSCDDMRRASIGASEAAAACGAIEKGVRP